MVLVLLMLSGAEQLTAQTEGVWLTSRQHVSGTYGGLSGSGVLWGTPSQASGLSPLSWQGGISTTSGMMASGSRYSAQITAVGAVSVGRPKRIEVNPGGGPSEDLPDPDATPLGDTPFLLLLAAAAGYALLRRRFNRQRLC